MTKSFFLKSLFISLIGFSGICEGESFAQDIKEMLYVGTYTERDSQGIYVFEFDRAEGRLTQVQTISDRDSPTYLDIHPNGGYLYAANRQGTMENPEEGSVSTFQINQQTGELKH
uniref:lactonase family protein n=1 Tax=Aquiflexum sp. TaxID=1872584 RepID=UPI0035935AA1